MALTLIFDADDIHREIDVVFDRVREEFGTADVDDPGVLTVGSLRDLAGHF